ncbi:MAG: YdcF family protein [Bacteroidales bacterium]|nr:YdcF family protein [Bacteroidales bacterium]MDY0085333.1 YdcF family protein [Bacteroidales bacterium]
MTNPDIIVLMGAGGTPGSESLLRCYYSAEAAHEFPATKIIIAFPADTADFENRKYIMMINELMQRGIDSSRIFSEVQGHNTYTQAVNIRQMISPDNTILIITSPVHTYRSIKTFEKQGFKNVRAQGTTEGYTEADLFLSKADRDKKIKSPDANPGLRCDIWRFLQYEIAVLREWTAIAWYKLKGYM